MYIYICIYIHIYIYIYVCIYIYIYIYIYIDITADKIADNGLMPYFLLSGKSQFYYKYSEVKLCSILISLLQFFHSK